MRRLLSTFTVLILLCVVTYRCRAEELYPPSAPESVQYWMPESTESFGKSVESMLARLVPAFQRELPDALHTGAAVFACVLFVSLLRNAEENHSPLDLTGAVCIAAMLLRNSRVMFTLAVDAITQTVEYEKLFLPVITAAAAAQGRFSAPSAMYIGTSIFTAFLNSMLRSVLFPTVALFLAASVAHCAIGEKMLKQIKEQIKSVSVWVLKTAATVFFTYMSITGAVTGAADRMAVKTAKAAISTVVPIIGGSLAEASEALLVSAELVKNSIGVYGVFVFIAVFLSPFVRIGTQYLVLKGSAALCAIIDSNRLSNLVNDFCTALGLLLAMTGTMTVFSVIGAVCYLKIS